MLGISIYPDKATKSEILNYIDMASSLGYKRIFTCLLSAPKGATLEELKDLYNFIGYAKKKGMLTSIDVSPKILQEFNISKTELSFFNELEVDAIRLDEGFGGKEEAHITYNPYNIKVEINASIDTPYPELIKSYVPKKGNLVACHNFYPQRYSGLEYDFFLKTSKRFKELNLPLSAFIGVKEASQGPWPLNDNAVTLELHRELDADTQLKHFYALDNIDTILLSTQFASEEILKKLATVDPDIMSFKLIKNKDIKELEEKIVFEEEHFRRGDSNAYSVRSTQSRVVYKDESFPVHSTKKTLKRGDVIIGNDLFKQYKGELHIVLKDTTDELGVKNVVGRIHEKELFLLDLLKPWQKFKFEEI